MDLPCAARVLGIAALVPSDSGGRKHIWLTNPTAVPGVNPCDKGKCRGTARPGG
jgi:hypothetical protein